MTGGAITKDLRPVRAARKLAMWILLALLMAGQIALRRATDKVNVDSGPGAAPLYFSSGVWLKRVSLGYEGLLADVYWTHAIQYYGRGSLSKRSRFRLLGPLLEITTTLDPHLIIAYRFGAIFLAGRPPAGAGRPQDAMQLLRRGIVANPSYWRLWEDLGFIEYWDLHDYAAAARDFRAGSERPGAEIWMKTLAAMVAAKGGEMKTSQVLWTQIYRTAGNGAVRQSALHHLAALKAVQDIQSLNKIAATYQGREGRPARSFNDLISAGLMPGVPLDPTGVPYVLNAKGEATLGSASKINLGLAQ